MYKILYVLLLTFLPFALFAPPPLPPCPGCGPGAPIDGGLGFLLLLGAGYGAKKLKKPRTF